MQLRLWFRSGLCLASWFLTVLLIGATIPALTAQSLHQYSFQQRQRIESLRQSFQTTRNENYARAVRIAKLLSQPLTANSDNGRVIVLDGIDEAGNLIYVGSTSTTKAGMTTRTSSLYAGGVLGLSLSGSSPSVQDRLGLWEVQGLPRATHVELAGRINQIDQNGTTSADGILHSTHVSGILIAQGKNPLVRGMAYGAKIQSYNQANDISEQTAASPNLLLSNHSYGTISGWYNNTSRTTTIKYEWRGDTTLSATDDYKYGQYSSDAQSWDKIAVNAPNYLIVAAAANDHLQDRPADGDPYYLPNNGNVISRALRNNQTGYDQIPTRGNAKNILTVAAVGAIANGYNTPTDVKLAYFSSWGPSDDGRIKPDISGVGLAVLSSVADTDSSYAIEQGTSMASPNVCGSLLLLQEYYTQLNPATPSKFLRSSTLRGLVLHTAEEAGDAPGPDYRFGWGLLNTEKAARVIGNTDKSNVLNELSLAQGASYSIPVVASGKGPLIATIAWTDPERITDGQSVSMPWVLDPIIQLMPLPGAITFATTWSKC